MTKKVLVGGCFDVLHFGHIEFLQKAKETGDFLIVALESDEFIKKRKKRRPVHNQEERARILEAVRYVDRVIRLPYYEDTGKYLDLVKELMPSVIAVTEGDLQIENKKKQAREVGAEVKIVTPIIKDFSSSKIIGHAANSNN